VKTIRCQVSWAVLLILVLGSLSALSQAGTEDVGLVVTRSISTAYALPDSIIRVALHIKADVDLYGVGIREVLPIHWTIHPIENAGAAFKRSEGEWVFDQPIEAGTTLVLTYEAAIPSAGRLLSDPLPQCFTIHGLYQATVPSFETPILGDSSIEVDSTLPISTAIAHLVPASADSADSIDLRLSPTISKAQLERALDLWRYDYTVPGTGGERMDLATISHLAALYETCTPAHEQLPISIDPQLTAVRTIETFLPCDSVLMPEGCYDPGLSAREVTVRVQITPSFDAYGVGLAEWFPPAWRVTPIEHHGFWYRASTAEWVYPTRVRAGETIEVVYLIEVMAAAGEHLTASLGCCGWEALIRGEASSALQCSAAPVTGEDTVLVQSCVPVLLAISRWDVAEDRFDATLSNLITLPQVQRAMEFWETSQPIPHTCGYSVGYHMLKRIVAYWQSGTQVITQLPGSPLETCAESPALCVEDTCLDGTLCRMLEAQDPDDFVGLPESPGVSVDGGPDRLITCAQPSIPLTATVTGGVPPMRYEWLGPAGQLLGETPSVVADAPGTYTIIVVSCGGCMAVDTVTVLGDFAAPQIAMSVSDVLTGYVTSVDIIAAVEGGTAPVDITWIGPTGQPLGKELVLTVSDPGTYALTAVTASGCSATASITVMQDIEPPAVSINVAPEPALQVAIDGADAVLTCSHPEVVLTGAAAGGREPYTLVWTNSNGAQVGNSLELAVMAADSYCLTVTGTNGCSASAWVTVVEDKEFPALSVSASDALSCAVREVVLTCTVAGGRAPMLFDWTDEAGAVLGHDATLPVTAPGVYTITATGANGCRDSVQIAVTEDIAPPIVSANVYGVLTCATAEATLTASVSDGRPPYDYAWTNAAGHVVGQAAAISVATPGTYRVRVTGANGCSAEAQVTVLQDLAAPTLQATVDGVLTCAETTVSVHVNIAGGRPPFEISWTNEAGRAVGSQALLDVSTPGVYTVRVSGANGCSATTSVTVTQDVAVPTLSLQADHDALTCTVSEVCLTSTVAGGRTPYRYAWTDEAGRLVGETTALTVSTPGAYVLTVTGANGCSTEARVTVVEDIAVPSLSIQADDGWALTCAVPNVLLAATVAGGRAPYQHVWVNGAGQVVGDSSTLTVSAPDTYTLTVTGANGCSTTEQVTVTEDFAAPSLSVSVDGVLTCTVTEVHLSAAVWGGREPYQYAWINGAGQLVGEASTLAVSTPGTYVLTVTGANGCQAVACQTVEGDIAPPSVGVGPDRTLTCFEPDIFVDAMVCGGSAPYLYEWRDHCGVLVATTQDVTLNLAGVYTLTVTGANGCSASDSLTVLAGIDPPVVDVGPDQVLACPGDKVILTATVSGGISPYEYVWMNACSEIVGNTDTLVVSLAGIYILTVHSANGCVGVDSVTVASP
jgi:hypothetical protein